MKRRIGHNEPDSSSTIYFCRVRVNYRIISTTQVFEHGDVDAGETEASLYNKTRALEKGTGAIRNGSDRLIWDSYVQDNGRYLILYEIQIANGKLSVKL